MTSIVPHTELFEQVGESATVEADERSVLAEFPAFTRDIKERFAGPSDEGWERFVRVLRDPALREAINQNLDVPYLPPSMFEVGVLLIENLQVVRFVVFFEMLAVPLREFEVALLFEGWLEKPVDASLCLRLLEEKYGAFTNNGYRTPAKLASLVSSTFAYGGNIEAMKYLYSLTPGWSAWLELARALVNTIDMLKLIPAEQMREITGFPIADSETNVAKLRFLIERPLKDGAFPVSRGERSPFLVDPRYQFAACFE